MRWAALGIFVVLAVLTWAVGIRLQEPPLPEHQVFLNGNIITLDGKNTVAEAMVVERDRITAIGSNEAIREQIIPRTWVTDLEGATVLPGFIDAHGHFPGAGLLKFTADLNSPPIGTVRDIAQLQAALRTRMESQPKGWILGIGYDDTLLAEKRHPTKAELDAVAEDRPVFAMHVSGHLGVANTAALEEIGITKDTPDPAGGRYIRTIDGELTGLIEESAAEAFQHKALDLGLFDLHTMIKVAGQMYLEQGVTTVQSGGVDSRLMTGMGIFARLRQLPQRFVGWASWEPFGKELVSGEENEADYEVGRVQLGAIKLVADGSLQGYTGYLTEPYTLQPAGETEFRGFLRIPREALREQVMAVHKAGRQLAMHGNGDAAIDEILDAVELAQKAHPRRHPRHILVHAQTAREDQLVRMKTLGVTPTFFSSHVYYWGDRHRDIFLGEQRAERISPTASAERIGLRYTIHLDTPVVPMNPRLMLWATTQRMTSSGKVLGAEQRISMLDALKATTIDAAWQVGLESEIGSLEVGKKADLVILGGDPIANPEQIRDMPVLRTIIGGRHWYENLEQ